MTLITASSRGMTPARLFRQCRRALQLSVEEMQDAICILDKTTILRIERGQIDVQGPTWVAISFLLDDEGRHEIALGRRTDRILEEDLNADPEWIKRELNSELDSLVEQVDVYIGAIRTEAAQRREKREEQRNERRGIEEDEDLHPRRIPLSSSAESL